MCSTACCSRAFAENFVVTADVRTWIVMCTSTAAITGPVQDRVATTFVVHWVVNFRYTALIVGRYIIVKFPTAANRSVRVVVRNTATSMTICYVKNVALATNILSWIIISVTTTARTMRDGIHISRTTDLSFGIVGTRTTSG